MPADREGVPVRAGFVIPDSELRFTFVRSSGPGGQNVNKTATKVRVAWHPASSAAVEEALPPADQERLLRRAGPSLTEDGSIQVVCDRFRTREANRRECYRKLAEIVRSWLKKPRKRIPSKPTRASREKRLQHKARTSQIKKNRRKPELE
jgi:ribosome-associated protein